MSGGTHLSKEFFELLKRIGESKSKQEEDRIIVQEVSTLKRKLESPPSSSHTGGTNPLLNNKKRAKEFLVRLLYVEMLGHDASFGYIKAVEMAASASLYHKRTGYLVCGACLSPSHEFRFMLVNQMQRDLTSSHILEICGGLVAATQLITSDMVPAMATEVVKLIAHSSETVRKKAIITMHRFHQISPETVSKEQVAEQLRKVLCDRDPSVMGSCLNVIEAMSVRDPLPYKDLIPSLVSILKQINEHRLPSDYDYHRVPAPWMQLKVIRILGVLGRNDAPASSGMYEILNDTLKKADVGINAGYAIVYECVRTIVHIYPNPTLLDAAAEAISKFIQSRSHNLKYLGVTGLAAIVESHPQYAAAHQLEVMDCLEDSDETLQRKTLDLLYKLVNSVNVEFITDKLLEFLRQTTDVFLKRILTTRICSVAERHAPNNAWYISTITNLFEISGDMVDPQVAQNLMSLIAEGTGESEQADTILRQNAVEIYAGLLKNKNTAKLPRILLETMAWCLGEYGYLSEISSLEEVMTQLCALTRKQKAKLNPTTRKFLCTAIMKLIAQAGTCPPHAAAVIDDFTRSGDVDLQQRCLEFQNLLTSAPNILGDVFPVDASCEDLDVDENLSFLDGFVHTAITNGSKEYEKPEDDDDDDYMYDNGGPTAGVSAFKMTPYEKPQTPSASALSGMRSSNTATASGVALPPGGGSGYSNGGSGGGSAVGVDPASAQNNGEPQLNIRNVANVWGKGGLATNTAPPVQAAASPGSSGYQEQASPRFGGAASSPSSSFGATPDPYGGANRFGAPPGASQPPIPKSQELIERERKAAALFGGITTGAAPPVAAPAATVLAPSAPPPPPVAAPTPAPAPPPAPAPAIDLLDMMSFDPVPTSAPPAADAANVDIFAAPTVFPSEPDAPAPAPAPVAVETVSDGEGDPASQQMVDDPFATSGLLGGVSDTPLASFQMDSRFEYNGAKMAPLEISTAQFGGHWGSCTATSPVSVTGIKVDSLDKFMAVCDSLGAYKIEAIAATNEGIAGGMVNGTDVALIHGKITPLGLGAGARVDITIKATDATLSGCLAVAVQNMMR